MQWVEFTGITWAIIGAFFSGIIPDSACVPNESFPILETILGKWVRNGVSDTYGTIVRTPFLVSWSHGSINRGPSGHGPCVGGDQR